MLLVEDAARKMNGVLESPSAEKNARRHVIEEHERQTHDVDIQIQFGIRKHVFRRIDQTQHAVAAQRARQHQQRAQHRAGDKRRIDRRLHFAQLFRAEELRDDDRAADVAAERKRDEDQRDFIAVADGSQRVFADEFARDKAVRDVVKLLKDDAAEKAAGRISKVPSPDRRPSNPYSWLFPFCKLSQSRSTHPSTP